MLCRVAEGLVKRSYSVHLASITDPGITPPAGTTLHAIGARRVRTSAVRTLRLIRRIQPVLILAGIAHVNLLLLMLRPFLPRRTAIVIRHDGVPRFAEHPHLMRVLYPRADAIICQTESMALELASLLHTRRTIHVLPNPIDIAALRRAANLPCFWSGKGPHLFTIGRLSPEKGFDRLLHAFQTVQAAFPTADLTLLGSGPEMDRLQTLAAQLGLRQQAHFTGQVDAPEHWFGSASLFVLPSLHDALPNALLEAAAAGLPIVASPAIGGVTALLTGKPGVWLAQDTTCDSLARTLCTALHEIAPGERFEHSWVNSFDAPHSIAQFDSLIRNVLTGATT